MKHELEVLEEDPRKNVQAMWQGAVLLSDEIKFYATQKQKEQRLIDPFDENHLKPASYDLTLGSECRLGGKPILLDEKRPYLEIPPYEVAVISTNERLNIPRFLIGRWNLRVKFVYEGLLWSEALKSIQDGEANCIAHCITYQTEKLYSNMESP